jgi:hypothetical protein
VNLRFYFGPFAATKKNERRTLKSAFSVFSTRFFRGLRCVLLHRVPRTKIAGLLDVVFHFYSPKRQEAETLGYCIRRVGVKSLIDHLSGNPAMANLLTQGVPADCTDFTE